MSDVKKLGKHPSLLADFLIILVLTKTAVDVVGYTGLGALTLVVIMLLVALLVALRNALLDTLLRSVLALAALAAWLFSIYPNEPATAVGFVVGVVVLYGIYSVFRTVGVVR